MKRIYLDNAATTSIRPEVIDVMTKIMTEEYGNPSSTHSFGRNSKALIETSRKSIAKILNCSAQEIVFTSCGTEGNNWILRNAITHLKVERFVTTRMEHHAVLHVIDSLSKEFGTEIVYLDVFEDGCIDYNQLETILSDKKPTLVTLMHVNNEIGCVLDIQKTAEICKKNNAFFHSDTVQSVGKTKIDLQLFPVDFLVASAHKFHGPKGIGFVFIRKNVPVKAFIHGGEQEKGLRAGTEPTHQIVGMTKALEMATENLEVDTKTITTLKHYCLSAMQNHFPDIKINGKEKAFYNILNVLLPISEEKTSMLLFTLDIKGIAVSRGSACQSGSVKPSHVLAEILNENDIKKPSLRISFCHDNTKEDVDALITALVEA